jgi:DNA sulfur modification protein DndD
VRLQELTLVNFGAYRGEQSLLFGPEVGRRRVTLVHGLNGAGKTTLLDAIQLALYGDRASLSKSRADYQRYLSEMRHRGVDAASVVGVGLRFEVVQEGEGLAYELRRSWTVESGRVKETLRVAVNDSEEPVLAEHWADHVEGLLPVGIARLFLFDGEQIEALAEPETSTTMLRSGVMALLGLGIVEAAASDLTVVRRNLQRRVVDEDVEQRLRSVEAAHAELVTRRMHALEELGAARTALSQAEATLRRLDRDYAAAGGALFEQRANEERRRDVLDERLGALRESLKDVAAGDAPLALVDGLLAEVIRLDEERLKVEVDHLVAARLLERLDAALRGLVSSGVATAGQASHIRRELNHSVGGRKLAAPPVRLPHGVGPHARLAAQSWYERGQPAAAELLSRLEETKRELADCESRLAATPTSDGIATLLGRRADGRAEVKRQTERVARAKEAHEAAVAAAERAEAKLNATLDADLRERFKREDVDRMASRSEQARTLLHLFRDSLAKRHVTRLEQAVTECFAALRHKAKLVREVEISPDSFEVSLRGHSGELVPMHSLSAGERQMLAVALLWGLAKTANRQLPVVIDTPLGRLDARHRRSFVSTYLPHASEQVIVLSTDSEVDERLMRDLKPAIARSVVLRHDETAGASFIEDAPFVWGDA